MSQSNEHFSCTEEMPLIPEKIRTLARTTRRLFLKWSVQRPILSLTIVIITTVTLLPLVTVATLMPISLLFTYTDIIASQGIVYITYNIVIQGLLLAMVIVALFVVGFALATSASVLHSYKIFRRNSMKKQQ